MKIQFGHSGVILDRFQLDEHGWCSHFWNSHDTFYLLDDLMRVHRYVDSIHLQCLRHALQPGQTCVDFTLRWNGGTSSTSPPWLDDLLRRHAYGMRAIHDELLALPWSKPARTYANYDTQHPDADLPNFEIYRSDRASIRTYSPFAAVKPLKEAPKKWTVAHVTRALLAGQFSKLKCNGVYSDDYAYDAAIDFHRGDFSDHAVHFAKRIIESPSGWWASGDRPGTNELSVSICCHSFDSNEFTFQLQPDPNMARYNPLKTVVESKDKLSVERPAKPAKPPEPQPSTLNPQPPSAHDVAIKQAVHTKRQVPIWIARLGTRVERDEFKRVLAIAKEHGGYWSNYGPEDLHGFIFFEHDKSRAFATQLAGNGTSIGVEATSATQASVTDAVFLFEKDQDGWITLPSDKGPLKLRLNPAMGEKYARIDMIGGRMQKPDSLHWNPIASDNLHEQCGVQGLYRGTYSQYKVRCEHLSAVLHKLSADAAQRFDEAWTAWRGGPNAAFERAKAAEPQPTPVQTPKCGKKLHGFMPPCVLDVGHAGDCQDGFGGFYKHGETNVLPVKFDEPPRTDVPIAQHVPDAIIKLQQPVPAWRRRFLP